MSLTQQQTRRRRIMLIASGAISVALLAASISVPLWDAGAGGLERGERARLAREPQTKPETADKMPAKTRRLSADDNRREPRFVGPPPTGQLADAPIAVPAPRGAPSRLMQPTPPQPYPPLPRPMPRSQVQPVQPEMPREATVDASGVSLETLKALFRRPPPLRPAGGRDAEEVLLGARLFNEKKLSADHKMSCATCHDPELSFTDGRRKARGNKGQDLPRNTPALWNLDTARAFYWDGRAPSLEAQIKDAVEREGEMDATLEAAVVWLSQEPSYVAAFQRAFGGQKSLSPDNILKALAAYERTLVSPETRFDRWVDGDIYALSEREVAGLRLFTGKGRCLACHGGWRLTDDGFHDIGLRSSDLGRQGVVGGPERAFKTPSLREVNWSTPYMHDGSLKTLEDVVGHYAGKLDSRPSLAPELKRGISLTRTERIDLIAFLRTLSSDSQPKPPPLPSP